MSQTTGPEKLIEEQLDSRLSQIEETMNADAFAFVGPITFGVDDFIRDHIEAITPKKDRLAVLLETPGGYIEVAQRIADTFRHFYREVDFIIPNFAMSAGTVLAMCGDAIYMDYYSTLGPIDPQVERAGKSLVPALGYLEQFERLIQKAQLGTLLTALLVMPHREA